MKPKLCYCDKCEWIRQLERLKQQIENAIRLIQQGDMMHPLSYKDWVREGRPDSYTFRIGDFSIKDHRDERKPIDKCNVG